MWFIADDGRRLMAVDRWRPRCFVKSGRDDAERLRVWVEKRGVPAGISRVVKLDLMSGNEVPVWELRAGNPAGFGRLMGEARTVFPRVALSNGVMRLQTKPNCKSSGHSV